MSGPILEFANVTKRYGAQTALDDVSLRVEPGERLALLGHNGAGKTTAMKLALGLNRPSEGAVRVLGVNAAEGQARGVGRMIGFLPESIAFHDAMTGRETLDFYARLKGEPVGKGAGLLDQVGLCAAAGKRVKTYSKGMRQRLGLAQALLGNPRLLLLDEPTTGLDPAFRQTFYEILHALAARGSTIVLSSHALTELELHTDRVAILNGGKLVASGTLTELGRVAGLRAHIRIAVPAGRARPLAEALHSDSMLERVNDRSIELSCAVEEKLELLRRIGGLSFPIEDVEVASPRLNEVFAHFTGGRS